MVKIEVHDVTQELQHIRQLFIERFSRQPATDETLFKTFSQRVVELESKVDRLYKELIQYSLATGHAKLSNDAKKMVSSNGFLDRIKEAQK
jgi:Na+/phosphate symporter